MWEKAARTGKDEGAASSKSRTSNQFVNVKLTGLDLFMEQNLLLNILAQKRFAFVMARSQTPPWPRASRRHIHTIGQAGLPIQHWVLMGEQPFFSYSFRFRVLLAYVLISAHLGF